MVDRTQKPAYSGIANLYLTLIALSRAGEQRKEIHQDAPLSSAEKKALAPLASVSPEAFALLLRDAHLVDSRVRGALDAICSCADALLKQDYPHELVVDAAKRAIANGDYRPHQALGDSHGLKPLAK